MTTLTKVGQTLSNSLIAFKNRVCTDGRFCDDVAMGILSVLTIWMMYVAMLPIF